MNKASTMLVGLICASGFSALAQAIIEGNVSLARGAAETAPPSRYVNVSPGEVGPPSPPVAVVYLEGKFPDAPDATTNAPVSAQIVQERFQFLPAVLPVRTGTTVEFPNRDDAYHNVFSYSKTKRFDLGRYRKDEKPAAVTFDKPGVVKLFCEVHEHMRGTILVLDTPHFTLTDTNGNFRLEHLPAGNFTLKVWLNEKTELTRAVELKEGAALRADFTNP